MERTLAKLREFAAVAEKENAQPVAVGTRALRRARNAAQFLEAANAILGVPVEIISGEKEAELSYRGAIQGLEGLDGEATVIDVGGGSTELARGVNGRLLETGTLHLGAVVLTEKHELAAPVIPAQISAMVSEIDAALVDSGLKPAPPLIAAGGTATTLAAVVKEVEPYDPGRIHGTVLSTREIDETCRWLGRMSVSERRRVTGLESGRADIIVSGTLILGRVAGYAGAGELVVSNGGVRFGLLGEMIGRNPIDSGSIST
jgi:exopolyphosphatase/guanosine-5'-triphosphate,3'-diphosphate pyrophosphatase